MGFSLKKAVNSVAKVVNPVSAPIQKLTGLDPSKQLTIGAMVGGGMLAGGAGAGAGKGALMGPLLGLAGNIYSANLMAKGQEQANEANLASAREQMQFQEMMSSTAHQREVRDLMAAGLNPVLSANSGAPMGSGQSATIMNEAPNLAPAISGVMEVMKVQQDIKESGSRIAVNEAQKGLIAANAKEAIAKADMLEAQRVFQQLENDLYIDNGHLMLTEHATKIIKSMSEEARGWLYGLIMTKFGQKVGTRGIRKGSDLIFGTSGK